MMDVSDTDLSRNIINLRGKYTEPMKGHLKLGGTNRFGQSIEINSRYIIVNQKPSIPVMGEFHFSRYPEEYWDDEIQKMKMGGIKIISTYVFWIHHEEIEGKYVWTGNRNLRKFISLCQKNGLQCVVRIGPWCHGEVRNGGFPDWILGRCKLRCNDPEYLKYVNLLYKQIALQLEGLLFKDGGPVIGIQLENELASRPEHLETLKRMAIENGIDVPVYTATAWSGRKPGGSWIPRDEMLPVFAGYPDGAWDKRLTSISPGWLYFFHHVRNDLFIGNDLFGSSPDGNVCDSSDISRYPYVTCELGAGMCSSYHRRPIITEDDICAMVLTKLGNGNNLVGYYMYHGGSNPVGQLSTLHESKDTGYPNDYSVISYDYQAPLGEYGQIRPSYGKLNCLHMFLNDFGEILAPMVSVLPEKRPTDIDDKETLRYAVRTKDDSGFLFVNNYERNSRLKKHENVVFELELDGEILSLPRRGMTIETNSYFILPFNLRVKDLIIKYSTAQLLCRIENGSELSLFFFSLEGIDTEYVFDSGTVSEIKLEEGNIAEEGSNIIIDRLKPGTGCTISVITASGNRIRIVTLTQQQAERCRKGEINGREHLFMTEAGMTIYDDQISIFSRHPESMAFSVYPGLDGSCLKSMCKISESVDGIFKRFDMEVPEICFNISYYVETGDLPETKYKKYLFMKKENEEYALKCRVDIQAEMMDYLNELYLEIDYIGDVAQGYINGTLIADEYYKGTKWEIGLKRFRHELEAGHILLLISPLCRDAAIFLENWPEFDEKGIRAEIRNIRLIPEYKAALQVFKKSRRAGL